MIRRLLAWIDRRKRYEEEQIAKLVYWLAS